MAILAAQMPQNCTMCAQGNCANKRIVQANLADIKICPQKSPARTILLPAHNYRELCAQEISVNKRIMRAKLDDGLCTQENSANRRIVRAKLDDGLCTQENFANRRIMRANFFPVRRILLPAQPNLLAKFARTIFLRAHSHPLLAPATIPCSRNS